MTTLTYQERFKTTKGVFDAFTNRTLFTLQTKGIFDELESPLSVGKEANVFIARAGDTKVIVKIYRMQNADFKTMFYYIKKDPRYDYLKNNRRQIILAWTQREYKNLIRAYKAKSRVPEVLGWKNNVIVEEFIGNETPAPPLKDQYPAFPYQFLQDILTEMKKLYDAGLIHGDLSSFNILNHNEKPVLIDFSQATLTKTPNSRELLQRDIKNVTQFFKKLQVDIRMDKIQEMFKKPEEE
jgi:RIO kinase 1